MIELSLFSIVVCGIFNVLIGFVWYHPKVFGTYWMKASGISPETAEKGKKMMPVAVFCAFLAAMTIAWVLGFLGIAIGVYDWVGAVFDLALWVWLGFIAPILLGAVLWEGKPFKLYLVNSLYWLLALIVMSLVLFYGSVSPTPMQDEAHSQEASIAE
ncbi:MAG: hypothetical protein RIQ56_999 [Candidatus Parcubacteria bacterium]